MEVNAARVQSASRSLLDLSRTVCRSRNLCFRCLSPIFPSTHTGSLNCPNPPVLAEQHQAFVDCNRQQPLAKVSHVSTVDSFVPPLTYVPQAKAVPLSSHLGGAEGAKCPSPVSTGFDEFYEDYEDSACATVEVPVSTFQIRLDCSVGSCLLVPVSFKLAGQLIPATILVDTGVMANFINEQFVQQHNLRLRKRKTPIRCVGFDGREGVGGLVTQD